MAPPTSTIKYGAPALNEVVADLTGLLGNYLDPSPPGGLPKAQVLLAGVNERMVGIGRYIGEETRASFGVTAVKAVRLDVLVRFVVWGVGPDEVATATTDLNGRLLHGSDDLRAKGVLRLDLVATSAAELVEAANAWRTGTDYRILYERPYLDTDGAQSLIARIPVRTDLEEQDPSHSETTVVIDEMVRWDNLAAPALVLRGPGRVTEFAVLSFLPPPPPTKTVVITRTFAGATGSPSDFPSLTSFLAAVSGPNPATRHARTTFSSPGAFLGALGPPSGDPVELGDWNLDKITDPYEVRSLAIAPPIELPTADDRLEIVYEDAAFDQLGVAYLRAAQLRATP